MTSTLRLRLVESAAPTSTQSPAAGVNQTYLFVLATKLSARQSKWAIKWRRLRLEIVLAWVPKFGHAWTARCASRTMRIIAPNKLVWRSLLVELHIAHHWPDTYNAPYPDGTLSQGGYASHIRAHEYFTFQIPDNISSELAAPMVITSSTLILLISWQSYPVMCRHHYVESFSPCESRSRQEDCHCRNVSHCLHHDPTLHNPAHHLQRWPRPLCASLVIGARRGNLRDLSHTLQTRRRPRPRRQRVHLHPRQRVGQALGLYLWLYPQHRRHDPHIRSGRIHVHTCCQRHLPQRRSSRSAFAATPSTVLLSQWSEHWGQPYWFEAGNDQYAEAGEREGS